MAMMCLAEQAEHISKMPWRRCSYVQLQSAAAQSAGQTSNCSFLGMHQCAPQHSLSFGSVTQVREISHLVRSADKVQVVLVEEVGDCVAAKGV